MNSSLAKQIIMPIVAFFLITICLIFTFSLLSAKSQNLPNNSNSISQNQNSNPNENTTTNLNQSDAQLYEKAVEDAMVAKTDEILPIISLVPSNVDQLKWNADGKVLMVGWHNQPNVYVTGVEVFANEDIRVFSSVEFVKWYKKNNIGITDWNKRFKQLLGLPLDSANTHFTGFWISPDNTTRPSYVPEVVNPTMQLNFDKDVTDNYKIWFNDKIIESYYGKTRLPWTRLGYTYDWSKTESVYGLSEFLIDAGSYPRIEFTLNTNEFVEWLKEQE